MKRIDQVIWENKKLAIIPDSPSEYLNLSTNLRADLFYYQGKHTVAGISAINFPDEDWEHTLYGIVVPTDRVPTYEEMAKFKDMFFYDHEVAIQVHPRASDYINLYEMLHFWRDKNVSPDEEDRIRLRELSLKKSLMENVFPTLALGRSQPYLAEADGQKVLAIISKGESNFPTWYEVKSIKERFWGKEEAAVQYNLGKRHDLRYPIILLWDAKSVALPPKRLI